MNIFSKLKEKNSKPMPFWRKPKDEDLSKQRINTRPARRDMKGGLAANEQLLKGLYTGSSQELALASYLSDGMVDVPKNMVGVPGIIQGKDQDDKLIKELMPLVIDEFPIMVATMLVEGTVWRWARWSDKLRKLTWEAIPDASVTSIIIDVDTGDITELYIEEQIEYNKSNTSTAYTTRKRHITQELITETWTGAIKKSVQYKNPFGFMPIPFGHRCYQGEWRGNSVYARVLRWMKSIHDIAYKRDEILSDFEPKISITTKDPGKWLKNNVPASERDNKNYVLDPFGNKLFINGEGEKTEFLFLTSDATAQHTAAIKDNELKVIKGSGIPELFFGALATGNHASTETDVLITLEYVQGIRRELTKGVEELVNQSLKIMSFMRFTQPPKFSIQWGNLSLLSTMQKAQVMGSYASAIVPLLNNGSISSKGALFLTKLLYPEFPVEDEKSYLEGLSEMIVQHTSKLGQPTFDDDMGGY